MQTALALVVLAAVLAIGLGRRLRTLRGLACAGAAVLVFVVSASVWLVLLTSNIIAVDRLLGVLKMDLLKRPAAALLFWGPPGLAALATVLALRRWTERT